ncbi:MAG: dihydroorotase [Bryobacteraceae bacterium]|nr:dihydroorotase [Bryobacteraceae bacterium]
MKKLLIRNGRMIDPATQHDGVSDVLLEGSSIAAIGQNLAADDVEVFDASGMVVAPGFLDIHAHFREPGLEHAETIETGSRAAAAGGFSRVCCMPNTDPVNDSATVTGYILEQARRAAIVKVHPIGAITQGSAGEELAPLGTLREAGVVAISDDGRPVMNARVMRRAMELARSFGLTVVQHCEDLNLSAGGDMHEGIESVRRGLRGIPSCAEDVMVARDLLLTELTGARYHVAHLSTRNSAEMVAFAKARGLPVSCEVTPHHITFADEHSIPYDSNFKMKPPLRGAGDIDALIEAVANGTVDAIATDHAPHTGYQKMQEFERCPFGITGLETALAVALDRLVHSGRISLMRLVELFTTGPARVFGLDCGRLAVGGAADVTIFDPDLDWTYDVNQSMSKSRNSPFHNRRFRGGPVATIVDGVVVWKQ